MVERRREDAALETALEIELGAERAPDVAALLFATEQGRPVAQPASRFERWLVAALLLVAAGVVTLIAVADRSGSEAVPLQQDPERRLRMFHRELVTPADLDELIDNFARVDSLTLVRGSVSRPDGKGEVAIAQHPLEDLAGLFGQGLAKAEFPIETPDLSSWQRRLALVLSDVHEEPGPRFGAGSIELVWRVPERGELVCWLQRGGDGVVRLGVQGLPLSWRGRPVDNLFGHAEELLRQPTQAALRDRGIALGGEGLAALPADASRLRLYGLVPDDVAALRRFRAVRQIDLSGCPRLLDVAALRELARVVAPRSLILPEEGLEAAHLEALLPMPIEELFVGDPFAVLTRSLGQIERDLPIDDEEAAVLARFGKLRELSIPNCSISDAGVARLAPLPLRRLLLGSTAIDGSGFEAFLRSPTCELRGLVLRGTGSLRPESFDIWARMESVEQLGFMECLLPNVAPRPKAEVRRRALASWTVDASLFEGGLSEGLPALLSRYASCRELRIGLLEGQVGELAKLELPIPVERIEVLVGTPDQIAPTRQTLAGFAARHPDLRLSVDAW